MSDVSRHYFCVAGNARLAFEDVGARIALFISDRLAHFGVGYEHCSDWTALEVRVRELLATPPPGVDYIVLADVMNPFCDMALVSRMTETLQHTNSTFNLCDGAVPGTEVHAVLAVSAWHERAASFSLVELVGGPVVRWETQAQYNNQLNLYKYKRIKQFLVLTGRFDDLHKLAVPDLMAFLATNEAFALLARFGADVRQIDYERCPHCDGGLHALSNTMSQPLCGYLSSDRPLYHECESCGLVVQSPSVHEDDVHRIYDKWDKEDFVASTNNPYTNESVRCDLSRLLPHLPSEARTLDLGGGVGNFSRFLHATYPKWDVTHSDFEIKADAPDGVRSRTLDFTRSTIGMAQYDLITAWEVIEHVPYHKLSYMLSNIWGALAPGGFFVFSTPDFDSPLCKSFDFYAICPPFHYLVFGQRWLRSYFADSQDFEVFDVRHCSDFLDDALNWYGYGSKTCPSMAMRGTAQLLHAVFQQDVDKHVRNRLAASGMGTEIVMTLRKKSFE
jgi:2-polyprenyl-3-methyl-5-hydroxy-6-metoxy-1,4-benzoquinol methylase